MQLRDLLQILRERWFSMTVCVLLAVAASAGMTASMMPVYEAHTRIFLSSSKEGFVITGQDLGTFMELLGSPVMQDPIRETLGLPEGTALDISASVSEDAPILDVTARALTPTLAADIANAVGPQLGKIGSAYAPLLAASGGQVKSTVILPATPPVSPKSPNLAQNLALGLLSGLALGLGVVLLQHFLDTKVRSEADIRALSDLPILGRLRRIKNPASLPLVMESEPHSVASEEFRKLRTNLQFVDVTTGSQHAFAVTSAGPNEGKTTAAINLALAVADSGQRVLLVDCDLRHPSVARLMGLEGAVGLTTLLLRRSDVDTVVQRWRDTSLDVLAAGEIPPNPSELIGSDAMRDLFEELVRPYDFVIVDSPPVTPVVDPVLIDRLVGGLLMVVTVGRTNKRDLSAAVKSLETVGATIAGITLNMVPGSDSYYAYAESQKRSKPPRVKRSGKSAPQRVKESVDL